MSVRFKFKCVEAEKESRKSYEVPIVQVVKFSPVTTGHPENAGFGHDTPSGTFEIALTKVGSFEVGQEYYIDISPAVGSPLSDEAEHIKLAKDREVQAQLAAERQEEDRQGKDHQLAELSAEEIARSPLRQGADHPLEPSRQEQVAAQQTINHNATVDHQAANQELLGE
jgi:hypothetical protein